MIQLGQYPAAGHVIAHISDTHFLGGAKPLYGSVETDAHLLRALTQLEDSGVRPEAIVFTGDLADLGEPDAYTRLRALVEPVAERLGATIIWVMGNHDERLQYSKQLFDIEATAHPQDRVYDLNGLRIILIDFWNAKYSKIMFYMVIALWVITMLGFAPRHLINVFSH